VSICIEWYQKNKKKERKDRKEMEKQQPATQKKKVQLTTVRNILWFRFWHLSLHLHRVSILICHFCIYIFHFHLPLLHSHFSENRFATRMEFIETMEAPSSSGNCEIIAETLETLSPPICTPPSAPFWGVAASLSC